jgi:predicted enzyme related to lactoylglutathione lyase
VEVLGIDNVFLEVGDLEEAARFYRDVLGLPIAKRFDAMGTILFQVGAETPGLGVRAVSVPRVGAQKIWFEVADARAAATELRVAGVSLLAPPMLIPTGYVVEVVDPWGNIIGLTDYAAKPELGRIGDRHSSAGAAAATGSNRG